ncbi:MAG: EF-hand domain-containing protein [Rhizobiales bacterium]|nr:EF-hand domain-containing protein [Hyphomicrobiales bacterium]
MTTVQEAVRRLRIEVTSNGTEQATGKLNAMGAAYEATAKQAASAERQSGAMESRMAALQRQYEAANRQQAEYNRLMLANVTALSASSHAANDNVRSMSESGLKWAEWANHVKTAGEAAYFASPKFRALVNSFAGPALAASTTAIEMAATEVVRGTNLAGKGLIELSLVAARSSTALTPVATQVALAGAAMAAWNPTIAGVAASILGRLLPALRLLGTAMLIYDAVKLVGEAWELGGKKLEDYRKIAERAAAVDLSTAFFQRISKAAQDAKLPVDTLTAALKHLNEATTDKLGGSDLQQRLNQHLKAGNFTGNSGVIAFGQANNAEDRFRAIVRLIDEAMQKGQRLAALDLANTAFGPEITARLRDDSEYLRNLLTAADKVSQTQLVSDADVGRALDLQRRYDAAVAILEQRWHPIQDLLTAAGIRMHEVWVGIVEAVAAAVDGVIRLAQAIADRIPQRFWDLLKNGVSQLPSVGAKTALNLLGPAGVVVGAAASAVSYMTGQSATTAETAKLTAAMQNQHQVQLKLKETNTINNRVLGDTSKTIDDVKKKHEEAADAVDRAINSLNRHIAQQEADARAVGLGAAAMARFRAEAAETAAIQANGGKITAEQSAKFEELKTRAETAALALAKAKVASEIDFAAKTALLSPEDVQIAQQLRGIYGNDVPAALDSTYAAMIRVVNATKAMNDAQRQAFTSLISDLSSGRTGMEALANATTGLLRKFSDMGANQVFDMLTGKSGAMNLSATLSFDTKATQAAVQRGVVAGFDAIQANAAAMAKNSPSVGGISLGTGGGAIGAGLAGAGALAGAFFNGQKTTDTGTAAGTGALSGGLAGFAIGGPIGAVVGAIGGAILGWFGANDAKKKQHDADVEAWEKAKVAEQAFVASLNGKDAGTLTSALTQAKAQVDQYVAAAEKVEDYAAIDQLHSAFATAVNRQVAEFNANFQSMLDALDSGLGFNSPIVQAQQNVKSIGDQLKAFIDDTDTSNRENVLAKFYGDPNSPQLAGADGVGPVVLAMRAAQDYALSLLQSVPVLSETQKAIQSIAGTANQLQTTLVDLGMSSLDAASRIEQGVKQALDALAVNFSQGLTTRLNAALEKSYLNSATALLVQHQQDLADAAALGSNPALMAQVSAVFTAEAQKIVNDAGLVGDAFDDFTRQFPELASIVQDASASLAQSAEEQRKALNASAKSIVDYVNGLYAGSSSALSPQDRMAAAQNSYQTTLALAQAGNADAQGRITTDSQNLLDAARAMYGSTAAYQGIFQQVTSQLLALPAVQQTTDPVVAAMRDAILAIKATTEAVNGTTSSIGVLQSQLVAALALNSPSMIAGAFLQSGATGLTYAQFVAGFPAGLATDTTLRGMYTALDANKDGIVSQLELLQGALKPAIDSGNAANIASALSTYFNAIDRNTDNTIDFSEMQTALAGMASNSALREMFTRLDTDNSGSITKLELIRGATQGTSDNVAYANNLQASANSLASTANSLLNSSNGLLAAIQSLQSTSKDQLTLLNNQLTNAGATVSMTGYIGRDDFSTTVSTSNNNLLTALNKIVTNTYAIAKNTYAIVQDTTAKNSVHFGGVLAGGGWITGGIPGVDSVPLAGGTHLGMPGEFVVRRDVAQAYRDILPMFNESGIWPSAPAVTAISALPRSTLPPPFPLRAENDNGDIRALMAEVKALREAVARMDANNVKVTAASAQAGARHVREGIDESTELQRDTNKRARRA